jgi:hypothetical protein
MDHLVGCEDDWLEHLDVEGRDDDVGARVAHPRLAEHLPDLGMEVLAVVPWAPHRRYISRRRRPCSSFELRCVDHVRDTRG